MQGFWSFLFPERWRRVPENVLRLGVQQDALLSTTEQVSQTLRGLRKSALTFEEAGTALRDAQGILVSTSARLEDLLDSGHPASAALEVAESQRIWLAGALVSRPLRAYLLRDREEGLAALRRALALCRAQDRLSDRLLHRHRHRFFGGVLRPFDERTMAVDVVESCSETKFAALVDLVGEELRASDAPFQPRALVVAEIQPGLEVFKNGGWGLFRRATVVILTPHLKEEKP